MAGQGQDNRERVGIRDGCVGVGRSTGRDDEEDSDKGTMTSREDIDEPDEDAEQDDNVSNGDEDVNLYAVRGGGSSEADKWKSVRSDGDKDKESLEAEETDEALEEEEIE